MKRENLENYELFYMELPQADYLDDIEIQDEYDANNYDEIQGLSDQQVSQIAQDSLDAASVRSTSKNSNDSKLFSEKPQKSR
jgi:hypothetical protein